MDKFYTVPKLEVGDRTYYPRIEASYTDPKNIDIRSLPTGRISVEDTTNFNEALTNLMSEFSGISPKFPIEYLDVIHNLSLVNPDISQMVDNIMQLGNTGHNVVIEGVSESEQEDMLEEINSFGMEGFKKYGGTDGFVNALFQQIARGGAASNEWVINENFDGIDYATLVPVSTIRFVRDKETDEYIPFQKTNDFTNGFNGLIKLNTDTYQYCAMTVLDNSPYAIPPVLSALESIIVQRDVIKNFRFVAKKLGLLGFTTFLLKAPTKSPGDSADVYLSKCQAYLDEQSAKLKNNYRDGIATGFMDNFKVEHHTVSGDAAGAKEIFEINEQQVFSGLKADPAMHGRTYSTTETYAGVVYEKMLAMLTNYQRTVKKVLEYGYKLQLILKGYSFHDLYVQFEPSKSLSMQKDEQAYQAKLANLKTLYDQGIISQMTYANEAGYDAPDVEEPRSTGFNFFDNTNPDNSQNKLLKFLFNKKSNRYSILTKKVSSYTLTQDENEEDFKEELSTFWDQLNDTYYPECGCETHALARDSASIRKLKQYINQYFRSVYPSVKGSRIKAMKEVDKLLKEIDVNTIDSEEFARRIYNRLEASFGTALDLSPISENVRKSINRIYKFYRLTDADPFGGKLPIKPSFHQVDTRAINFMRRSDDFYFGKFISSDQTEKQLKGWLQDEFLQSGRSLRDPGEMTKFREAFGDRVAQEDYKVLRVVETSVSRAKNWGNVLTVEQAKATTIKISGPGDDGVSCKYCLAMLPKTFTVNPVVQHVKDVLERDPEDLPAMNPFLPSRFTPSEVTSADSETLLAQGIALPPYHPHCRHTFVVTGFEE